MPTLLIVDDEPSILAAFRRAYRDSDVKLETAETAAEGLDRARQCVPDVIILDVQLPDMSGLEAMRHFYEADPKCPVIFITGKSTTDTAIQAMKLGAFEYLLKPLELSGLRQLISKALEIRRLMHVPAVVIEDEAGDDRADAIVGRSTAMQKVYKDIGRVATQDVTVLITGESGTGKELVARALYQHSKRANAPFLAINCAAIPEQLLESELFGHEKGAFTGADRRRIGKFEQCSGGTIFLDEVADLSPMTQSKMLRLLQEQRFERVGGNETVQTNVRLIAATNRDLEALTAAGQFRSDLYYRLSVFTIRLPPLRERGKDLDLLIQHYLKRFNRELDKDVPALSSEAMDKLRSYSWPGNVRELQSVLKQALLQAVGPTVLAEFLPASVHGSAERRLKSPLAENGRPRPVQGTSDFDALRQLISDAIQTGTGNLYHDAVRQLDRILLARVLEHTGGNQLQAARILGITRGSLRTKLRELGMSISRIVTDAEDE
jgi:two-component system nitrogen regulation response regulator GlnG